jgi:predicted HTH transcriptional regulator
MITSEQLQTILAFGSEQRGVEFKASGSLKDAHYRARVVRAVLGMANRRDGGLVVLGVNDGDPPSSTGLTHDLVAEWTKYDDVADQIDRYADPGVEFSVESVPCGTKSFVAIQVHEFLDQPVICQKAYQPDGGQLVLRRGAVYIRSSTGKIET